MIPAYRGLDLHLWANIHNGIYAYERIWLHIIKVKDIIEKIMRDY